jgi:D-beta-D-heptose 7-phosphate kinase/D-beta-D-heptose 1-phosphate adenosyltransferase
MNIVWVNGTFDILHTGHLSMLKYASQLGDVLCVGIDSDERIKQKKGESRPINSQYFRKELLQSLFYVDKVYIFESDYQLTEYIRMLSPKHMVIGDDYKGKEVIGADYCENITFYKRLPGFSTTEIIKRINNVK